MPTKSREQQILNAIGCTTFHISAAVMCLLATFSKNVSFHPNPEDMGNALAFVILFVPGLVACATVKLTFLAARVNGQVDSEYEAVAVPRNQWFTTFLAGSLLLMLILSQRADTQWMESISQWVSPETINTAMIGYCVFWSIGLIFCSVRILLLELKVPLFGPRLATE